MLLVLSSSRYTSSCFCDINWRWRGNLYFRNIRLNFKHQNHFKMQAKCCYQTRFVTYSVLQNKKWRGPGAEYEGTSFHFQYKESLITACPLPMSCKEREEYGTRQLSRTHREAICKANSLYSNVQNVSDTIRSQSPISVFANSVCIFTWRVLCARWKNAGQVVPVSWPEIFIFDKKEGFK
jgi:hypothetical protein